MVPLQKGRRATRKGGASLEMMGCEIRWCATRIDSEDQISFLERRWLGNLPSAQSDKAKRDAVFFSQLKAARFQYTLTTVIVAMSRSIAMVMFGMATAWDQSCSSPQAMRSGWQPSRQYQQCCYEPDSSHCFSVIIFGTTAQGFSIF